MNKKKSLVMIVLLVTGLLMTSCDAIGSTGTPTAIPTPVASAGVIAEANLVPAEYATFGFTIPGTVSEVLVKEGDHVEAGQVLARLEEVAALNAQLSTARLAVLTAGQYLDNLNENADLIHAQAQVDLIQARHNLIDAERAWDVVDTDAFQEDLDDARIEMNEAKTDLEEAQEDLDEDNPIREGFEQDVEDAQQAYDEAVWAFDALQNHYDLAKAQLAASQAVLEKAEQRVEDTRNGPDPDDMALANANLDQAEAQLKTAENALGDAELTAPFAGKVVRVELIEGTQVGAGALAVVLMDDSTWFLETNDLTEDEVIDIELATEVAISFDALPGESFTGEVESISDYFLEQYGDVTYVVRIRLLEEDDHLRWGMTAEVQFQN